MANVIQFPTEFTLDDAVKISFRCWRAWMAVAEGSDEELEACERYLDLDAKRSKLEKRLQRKQ
jgi:hypothetical protein